MTIELTTGLSRAYRREDYITKLAGTYVDRDCPIPHMDSVPRCRH